MERDDTAVMWFRQDLRISDNPALVAAARHRRLVLVYIWSPEDDGDWAPGAASRWWLHDSLQSLAANIATRGGELIIRTGPAKRALLDVCRAVSATAVYCNAQVEPAARARDAVVLKELKKQDIEFHAFGGSLLFSPEDVMTQGGTPYLVYGAYWRAILQQHVGTPLPAPKEFPPAPEVRLSSDPLTKLQLKPTIPWDGGFKEAWQVGERAALASLKKFDGVAEDYADARDRPAVSGTSRLSPHLHFGEISPRQVWAKVTNETYRKEIVWREFSYYLLFHHPHLSDRPLRAKFEEFPWEDDPAGLKAWQRGRTGFPIVDAGMRELWHTGWMHNRVRMIVASFLVKDLRVHWLQGARWFWDTLVDADLASNTQGWQWTAGCGADAAPYFRVFNPTLQGKKFDPEGAYVRRWVPELAGVAKTKIHEPWTVVPESVYPRPIVDHGRARFLALRAFDQLGK